MKCIPQFSLNKFNLQRPQNTKNISEPGDMINWSWSALFDWNSFYTIHDAKIHFHFEIYSANIHKLEYFMTKLFLWLHLCLFDLPLIHCRHEKVKIFVEYANIQYLPNVTMIQTVHINSCHYCASDFLINLMI